MQTASVPHIRRLCRRRPFWEGVWDQFRAWERIGAQGCVLLARWRVQSAPRCAPRRPKVPKGTSKGHFWTSLGNPFGATLREWRLSSAVPHPLFCVPGRPPVRPSVAEGRHRAPKVTPDNLRHRSGDVRKSTKIPCRGFGGALGALGASRGIPRFQK